MIESEQLLHKDAVLRVGEITEVNGRYVYVTVDKNKNSSDLMYDGAILKNIAVSSFVEIRKGFLSIIGKVDAEKIEKDISNQIKRTLQVSLIGSIGVDGVFTGGTKELPLIGNEVYLVTENIIHTIHNLVKRDDLSINIATTDAEEFELEFPVDGLFNSHIAIFGNTGSGKSNTLARLYQGLIQKLVENNKENFLQKCKFILFDFNGEYTDKECIYTDKVVYNLSTSKKQGDYIPLNVDSLLDFELLSILAEASDKTQKPFLKRSLELYSYISSGDDPLNHLKNVVRKLIVTTLSMTEKQKAHLLIDYLKQILPQKNEHGVNVEYVDELEWHNKSNCFHVKHSSSYFDLTSEDAIKKTKIYSHVDALQADDNILSSIIRFMYVQLIRDVLANRTLNEHVAPMINRLKGKKISIDKVMKFTENGNLWQRNFVVINMHDVNLEMRKTIPLLLAKKLYSDHKAEDNNKSLVIIVDEAHNILSKDSFREKESWKDYRLETFEEIIKEGRKFGVFVTISSQRPSDISATITSQAHNYFIHRLINQKDLDMMSTAVSYIDKITEESIPTLPIGTCIFSGVSTQMPIKICIKPLPNIQRPSSHTLKFTDLMKR